MVRLLNKDAINNNFNVMDLVTVDLHLWYDFQHLAVDTYFSKAHFANLFKQFAVVTFTTFYYRGKQTYFFIKKIREDMFYNLVFRLAHHFLSGNVGESFSGACVQQS